MSSSGKRAFSLVELVIVVVILGIIAAIAVPRVSSGSKNAAESALRANLATIRNFIDHYYVEHKFTFPGAKTDGVNAAKTPEAFKRQLKDFTNADGIVSVAINPAFPYGPYLRSIFPSQTVGNSVGKNTVKIMELNQPLVANNGDDFGWMYNITTGQFIANSVEIGSDGKPYSTW